MAAPKALPHGRKLGEQALGTFAFPPLDEATDGHRRWEGDHPMDMIRRERPLQDIDACFLAFLADEGTHPLSHLAASHLLAILSGH